MIDPKTVFDFEVREFQCPLHSGARCFTADWLVPASLPYLEGHFPGNPVLPAVAMVDASLEILRRGLNGVGGAPVVLRGLRSAKFMSPVVPGSRVEITLHSPNSGVTSERGEWQAEWKNHGAAVSGPGVANLCFRTS